MRKGLIDRFRSLPMSRAAVLGGRTLADVATNALSMSILVITGVIIGFSFHASFADVVAGIALLLLFGYAFSWFFAFLGLLVSSPESVNSVGFIAVFPLTFISSAFVPVTRCPKDCAIRRSQPVHDLRRLDPRPLARRARPNSVWEAVAWSLAIVAVSRRWPSRATAAPRASSAGGYGAAPAANRRCKHRFERASMFQARVCEVDMKTEMFKTINGQRDAGDAIGSRDGLYLLLKILSERNPGVLDDLNRVARLAVARRKSSDSTRRMSSASSWRRACTTSA